MIERYANRRRERLFRANVEEYALLQDAGRGHFPVYLRARGSSPDAVAVRAHWTARCAHTERIRLHECVNRFNDRSKLLTASVRESHRPFAFDIDGTSRFWVRDEGDFAPFARFVDMSLASAARLFEMIYAETQPHSAAA